MEHVEVTENQVAFGDDAQIKSLVTGEFFQNGASHLETAFGGLVGIRGGAERDLLARLDPAQLLPQQIGRMLLDVDLLLEIHRRHAFP